MLKKSATNYTNRTNHSCNRCNSWQIFVFLPIAAALLTSCSSMHVPLKPLSFKADEFLRASNSGLNLSVKPIESIHAYWELFDDNLPEIGIAAVWVVVGNTSDATIDLTHSQWFVQLGERKYVRMENAALFSRYYRGRNVRMYTVNADKRARLDLERMTLHPGRLRQAMQADGFVFFGIDPSRAPQWTRGARLQIRGIRIENGKRIKLNLPLAYASP